MEYTTSVVEEEEEVEERWAIIMTIYSLSTFPVRSLDRKPEWLLKGGILALHFSRKITAAAKGGVFLSVHKLSTNNA